MGALGIFFYVGAEVAIGSVLVNYFLDLNVNDIINNSPFLKSIATGLIELFGGSTENLDAKGLVGAFVMFYWLGAMVGRFIGSYLTKIFKPSRILMIFGLIAISLIVVSITSTGLLAMCSMWSILAVGVFNSIMFPTIFTLTLDGQGDLKPRISGLLCMAIVGGGVILPIFGNLVDWKGFTAGLLFLTVCYGYIAYFAFSKKNI